MLTIRLSRVGKKNKPMYRLIISEKARDPYGRALEILGSYNPHTKELNVKADRIKHWLSHGSDMSATVNNLLIEKEIIKGEKVKASISRKNKKGKTEEKPAEKVKKPEDNAKEPEKTEEKPVETEKPAEDKAEEKPEEKKDNTPAEKKKEEKTE